MVDINSLPVSGSVIFAGAVWAAASAMALGPIVAERTIQKSGWLQMCERNLRTTAMSKIPSKSTGPKISCTGLALVLFPEALEFCAKGGDTLFEVLTTDPTEIAREKARKLETARLKRIADMAPSACACANKSVQSDRVRWGLHAGSVRLIGDTGNLQAELDQALNSSSCNTLWRDGS